MATDLIVSGQRVSLVTRFASKYGIEPGRMLETLKQTCFRTEKGISNEQMAALLLVCEANDLNPFVRMVHALLDKAGNVVPFVGIDGWISLVNRRPEFDGVDLQLSEDFTEATCTMWRKDRSHPTRITEYLAEVKRGTTPWSTSPRRMLRHRAYVQCARVAFGFPGLHDEYDAHQIVGDDSADPEARPVTPPRKPRAPTILQPEPVPVDVDDDYMPPPKSSAEWMEELIGATDQETAALIVDEARGLPVHPELVAAYTSKWTPKE